MGDALTVKGNKIMSDPPDPAFTSLPVVASVRKPLVPARSGRFVANMSAYIYASRQVVAYSNAMASAIDKAGGARAAGNLTWVGRQTRAAIAFARAEAAALTRLRTLQARVAIDLAAATRGVKPLTAAQIARARAQWAKPVPTATVRLLSSYGLSVSTMRANLAKVRPGARVSRTLVLSPYVTALVNFEIAVLTLYPKNSQIIADAALA